MTAAAHYFGSLNMAAPTIKCRCGKVYTLDLKDAKRIRKRTAKHHGHNNQVRYYQCRYDTWHWTQQLEPPQKESDT